MEEVFRFHEDEEDVIEEEEEEEILTIKYDSYQRISENGRNSELKELSLALVSKHHSLWAEFIYNAARVLSDLIDGLEVEGIPPIDVRGKKCLELGAGAGLPSVLAAINDAKEVTASDYGHDFDLSLIYPLDINREIALKYNPIVKFHSVAYTWGYPVHILLNPSKYYQQAESFIDTHNYSQYQKTKRAARISDEVLASLDINDIQEEEKEKFDLIFAADLLFNRSEHQKLLWTIKKCLKPLTGICYITFSHHDPAKAALDLNFFTLAQEKDYQFTVEKLGSQSRPSYPFRELDGQDELRGVIHIYTLRLLS